MGCCQAATCDFFLFNPKSYQTLSKKFFFFFFKLVVKQIFLISFVYDFSKINNIKIVRHVNLFLPWVELTDGGVSPEAQSRVLVRNLKKTRVKADIKLY